MRWRQEQKMGTGSVKQLARVLLLLGGVAPLASSVPCASAAFAKEVYVTKNVRFSRLQAYELLPAPDYLGLPRESESQPVYQGYDLAIDTDSETLFVAALTPVGTLPEIALIDTNTLERIGQYRFTSGPQGHRVSVAFDHTKDEVYLIVHETNLLYAFGWEPTTRTLSLRGQHVLPSPWPSSSVSLGQIEIDEANGRLYATAANGARLYSYDTTDLTKEPRVIPFGPSEYTCEPFTGPAVDARGGYLYVGTYPGTGGEGFCQLDLNTGATRYVVTPGYFSYVYDVDVDPETGWVYMTNVSNNLETAQILIYDAELNLLSNRVVLAPNLGPLGIVVSGADTPAPIPVSIDVKPASDTNCLNNDGHGVIPVAILSDPTTGFDATLVDASSVEMAGLEVRAVGKSSDKYLAHVEDVDGDGLDDLVVQIEDGDGAFEPGVGTVTVAGTLMDGTPFEGTDSICVVP